MPTQKFTPAQLQALITGIPSKCGNIVFTLSGQTFTASQLVTLITSVANAKATIVAARATANAAVLAAQKTIAANEELISEARSTLSLMYNGVPDTLAALDVPQRKPRSPMTTAASAAAKAKADATRKARGTTSKKQKALISGNVTGVTITPVVTPTASTPAAAPAASPTVTPPASVASPTHS